jgi:hypothetical protein
VEDAVETITRGNPTEVKVVLATVVAALAGYQLVLAAAVYGRVTPRLLEGRVAGFAHRASGRVIAAITATVAFMCIAVFGFDLEYAAHVIAASALLAMLGFKIAVVRRGGSLGRYLPLFGLAVFTLFLLTWATSAGDFLADR